MFNVVVVEFLKLRRSKMLLLAGFASFLPALVKYLQYTLEKSQSSLGWEWFLASKQEIMVLAMLITVILVSSFVFSMEYQYKTASYIFTSSISKVNIFISKMLSLLTIIIFLFIVSAVSQLLFGLLAIKSDLSWDLFLKFIKVIAWYIFSYFLLSTIAVMLVVLIKKFVLSAVVVLIYLMLVLPFHLKNNFYICPFMTPTVVASKIFGSNSYIFTDYYRDIAINSIGAALFLLVLAAVSLTIGIVSYKK